MLAGSYQAVDVLMLVGSVGPIALYFLILGLVNSHSRPYLVTSRSDFILLTVVLAPLFLWPVPTFVQSGNWLPLSVGIVLASMLFAWILPRRNAGFVIYNISQSRCSRVLEDVIDDIGLVGRWENDSWCSADGRTILHLRGFSLLRNVTVHFENHGGSFPLDKFHSALRQRLDAISQLPSTTGASLVIVGVAMMILPMWMLTRHIDDVVDAMSNIFW